jgi:VanZ family protein
MRVLLIYGSILTFLSLNPWLRPDSSSAMGYIAWDKIDHAIAYGILSFLLISAYKPHKRYGITTFIVLLSCSLVGLLFEYCQHWFTSTRQFSYEDAGANALGGLIGLVLFWSYTYCRKESTIKD